MNIFCLFVYWEVKTIECLQCVRIWTIFCITQNFILITFVCTMQNIQKPFRSSRISNCISTLKNVVHEIYITW